MEQAVAKIGKPRAAVAPRKPASAVMDVKEKLAKASEIAAGLGTEVAGLLAATIARLCEGQVAELQDAFNVGRTEERYVQSIGGKTAALFATSCRIGGRARSSGRPG